MTNSKMTYAMALDVVLNGGEITSEVREKLEALKESVSKRNASKGNGKPTKLQKENEKLREDILDFMVEGEKYSIAELIKGVDSLNEMSSQKVSPLLKALVNEGKVKRIEDKRKIFFSLA